MKLSVFAVLLDNLPLREVAKYLADLGVDALEIGSGGYPGTNHCDPARLLADPEALTEFKSALADNNMELAALSTHGNAIHPDPAKAAKYQSDWENTLRLAEKLGIERVVTFSGCPAGAKGDTTPNWVTCSWPNEFSAASKYQWEEVLIPYWTNAARQANDAGVTKIALEMHPGFCVYNPDSCLRLREAVGDTIGCNLDPSHLFWQGIDIEVAIRALGSAIHFFHAKDTQLFPSVIKRSGVLSNLHYRDELSRPWIFRSIGYGHGESTWKRIFSALRMVGYDGYISIEHEDGMMSAEEGLITSINVLKNAIIREPRGKMFWA